MEKSGAPFYNKKAGRGAVICQKAPGACDFLAMNSLNRWCQMASLVCCLILGIEGILFGHDLAAQARLIEARPVMVDGPRPASNPQASRLVTNPSVARPFGLGLRESLD